MSSERIMRNGKILSEQELTLKGEGVYDVGAGRMRSLLIVGSGTFRWPEEAPNKPIPFDALIEWAFDPSARGTGRGCVEDSPSDRAEKGVRKPSPIPGSGF